MRLPEEGGGKVENLGAVKWSAFGLKEGHYRGTDLLSLIAPVITFRERLHTSCEQDGQETKQGIAPYRCLSQGRAQEGNQEKQVPESTGVCVCTIRPGSSLFVLAHTP